MCRQLLLAIAALFALCPVGSAVAEEFTTEIIITGLNEPQGINLDLYGNLYFTEVPSPGVAGAENTVSRYRLRDGKTRVVSRGEPYPTNLASDFYGNVYWTCQTAGVVLKSGWYGLDAPRIVRDGLDTPVGLDAPLLYPGALVHTEVPTPGFFGDEGGQNAVIASLGSKPQQSFLLSEGEPEPVDVAVDIDGTIYWTCKTIGVILERAPDGEISMLVTGLQSPTGLDIDLYGRLYWTEVPTPGVFGTDGGSNLVVRYDPETGERTVINAGDPEPVDVTVDLFGKNVFWTCRTAGVIIQATAK